MSDGASDARPSGSTAECQLASRKGAFLSLLGVLALLSWQLVPRLTSEDPRWLETRVNDRIRGVEGKVQALAAEVQKLSEQLGRQSQSPAALETREAAGTEAPEPAEDLGAPQQAEGADSGSRLHSAVLQKESRMPGAFKTRVAEECKAAMSAHNSRDDPFGPALFVRVFKEHRESGGGDCRRNGEHKCRGFVGQGLQDVFLYTVLWRHLNRPGVYIDLAAHDYRYISNTYFADHCLKFDGVCIEPNTDYHKGLDTMRRCVVVKTCIAEKKKDVTFILQGPFGGIESERKVLKKTASGGKRTTLTCQTLADVARQNKMTHIDFLSLDIEGAELASLQGIDWDSMSIDTILVEKNENSYPGVSALLASRGYVNATELRRDVFWVHQRASDVLAKVAAWNREVCPRINAEMRGLVPQMYTCH